MRVASVHDPIVPLCIGDVEITAIGWSSRKYSANPLSGKNLRTVSPDSCQLSWSPAITCCGFGASGNQLCPGTGCPRWQV